MTKRIFRSVVFTAMLSALLATVLIALSMVSLYEGEMTDELRTEAGYIRYALSREADEAGYFDGFTSENRVTLISARGEVVYDSDADAAILDNHADRPEVSSALEKGWGESRRYSSTLAETTYYYAVRTEGGNVLRVANTRSSVLGVFLQAMPLICLILLAVVLLSLMIARFASRRIVAPMNNLNLDAPLENEIYDELSPLLTRMDKQYREIQRQMRALNDARQEQAAITENMREGLILLDSRGGILTMNESAASIFGVDARTHVGQTMISVSRSEAVSRAVSAALAGRSADLQMERESSHYQLLANPVSQEGRLAGVVLLILDVTERYAAEVSRREFTANVSHELKTPLTSISGYAEIIRDGVALPEDVGRFAGRIHTEASRLLALINDILALSRLDEHRGIGERERVQLLSVARDAAHTLEKMAAEKNIALGVEGEAAAVSGHPVLLGEMIFNLIDNAVKYTGPGGRVDVRVYAQDGEIVCAVEDTGIGIPRIHQEHIFERFYRVDKSHSRATGGTGLGLSIVKHGAQIHGAQIRLDSEEGRGTRIEIRFPAQS